MGGCPLQSTKSSKQPSTLHSAVLAHPQQLNDKVQPNEGRVLANLASGGECALMQKPRVRSITMSAAAVMSCWGPPAQHRAAGNRLGPYPSLLPA